LYCRRNYELAWMAQAMELVRSAADAAGKGKGTIVDVGANIGVTSIGMMRTGEVERAVALEPEPQNFRILQHNVAQNGLSERVLCLPYAVSDRTASASLELSDMNFGDHRVRRVPMAAPECFDESTSRTISVPADTLDNLLRQIPDDFARSVCVIWIDVQGHEGYVFQGARRLLERGIPVVSEIWPYAIRRAGMSEREFCCIASSLWSIFYVRRGGRVRRYPISQLGSFLGELNGAGDFSNAVFMR
jgi:FkbM family methyltransferase